MKIPVVAKSCGLRAWTAAAFFIAASVPLAMPVNAEDTYGTFVAHVIYVDGFNGFTFPGTVKTLINTSGTITIPIGETRSGITLQNIEVQLSAPGTAPKAAVVGGALENPSSRLDFITYGGKVSVTTRVAGTFASGNTGQTLFADGLLSAGGSQSKLENASVGQNISLTEQHADLAANSSATVVMQVTGSTEIAQLDRAFHPGDDSFPPTTRPVFLSQIFVGFGNSSVRVDVRTYYDFSAEPKFPKISVEGLSPAECTPNASARFALLAPTICVSERIAFGTIAVGDGRGRTIRISNKGKAPLVIQAIELLNAPPDLHGATIFSVGSGTLDLPFALFPNQQANSYLSWNPNSAVDLEAQDTKLRITTDDPDQPVLVYPVRGQSINIPRYSSIPSPAQDISFGTVVVDEAKSEDLTFYNRGTVAYNILSISIVNGVPGLKLNSPPFDFPERVEPHSGHQMPVFWTPPSAVELGGLDGPRLRVTTDDPATPQIDYYIRGKAIRGLNPALEEILISLLRTDDPVARKQAAAPSAIQAESEDTTQTAMLQIDSSASKNLTAEVPAFLGGGSVQFNAITGNIIVSLIDIPEDAEHKRIRIESGLLAAPSTQLPGGLSTGPNTLAFGAPEESDGTLEVATGNYTARATGIIFNQLLPFGITVRGSYSGVYNAQSGKITVHSQSEDVFVASERALNISTRMRVLTGDNVLIAGFIILGDEPKRVIIRGIGPSLSGVGGALSNPTLELRTGNTLVASNDNWKEHEAEVKATTIPPTNDLESAIVATLQPGAYTAVLAGKNNGTGIGVVEVYDLSNAANARLANISSRGFVDTGDNVMIAGLITGSPVIVNGTPVPQGGTRVLVRAIGPSLGAVGVANSLQDPTLELRNSNGGLVDSNDNWRSDHEADIKATTIPPSHDKEAAIVRTLPAGAFTAIVRGVGNTTGIALVEVYNVP